MIKSKKILAVSLSLLMILATVFVSPMTTMAVDTVNKTMVVGDIDTSASDMYDNYSKIVTITANSTNPSVASIVIDPSAAHSVTVTALSVGQATINVYANGNIAMVYNITVTDGSGGGTGGTLNGNFVLVNDKGDIGTFSSNGTLSYTASADDYVWVRNYDTGVQYCTDGWQGFVDTVTLVNEHTTTQFNKLYVSQGTHTFTLIDNGDDTYILTYGAVAPTTTTQATTTASTPADDSKLKFQVLGDSIAVGYGLSSLSYGYPMLIANSKGYSLNNNAVNGHASYDLLDLLDNNTILSNLTKADLVSISIGGNDLLQNMNNLLANINTYGPDCQYVNDIIANLESNLGEIITKIHNANPNAVILLQTLYNPSEIRPIEGMDFSEPAKVIYPKLNATYTNVANSYSKVYVADVFTAFANEFAQTQDTNLIQADGIHPSESGNQVIFNTLVSKINELENAGILTPGEVVNPSTPDSQPTTSGQQGGNVLNGKFVLVRDKGDIGFFDANGTIDFTATEEELVWVRNYDTGVQYCTDGWQGQVDTVTLINEKAVTTYFHKLYVTPGAHTFTLIDNGNDTYTLTYGEVVIPTQTQTETTTTTTTTPTPTYLYGDTDGDGDVNVKDATLIQKHSASIVSLDSNSLMRGDVDGNNTVDVRDATLIQKFSAGIIDRFPCE